MKLCELTVSRTIPASAEEVFDVWVDSNTPGGPWFGADRVIINPAVDGLFFHTVAHEGRNWAHYGRFLAIERPRRIQHTWVSESTKGVESTVTVTLEPKGNDATLVTLVHKDVPDDEQGRQHQDGWDWMLASLVDRFTKPEA
ncbi:MAG TPA: SRPBCC domain-containing protein [Kofleriaceae bacterium]|nr:SRPBCC domain-containing protein [Kofleriaceae bacterium]